MRQISKIIGRCFRSSRRTFREEWGHHASIQNSRPLKANNTSANERPKMSVSQWLTEILVNMSLCSYQTDS